MSARFTSWKLLLVEDDDHTRATYGNYIKKELPQVELLAAPDGRAALEITNTELPDLIVTDWEMPHLNGLEFIQQLKTNKDTASIPVIMVTGIHMSSHHMLQGLDIGAIDFVRKPIIKVEFLARIKAMLKLISQTKALLHQQELTAKAKLELQQEQAERALQKVQMEKELAEHSERVKRQFFSRITHEFRTPLTLIKGPLETIIGKTSDPEISQPAEMALRNSRIMLHLINQLLDLSKAEAGFLKAHIHRGDLLTFIRERVLAFEEWCSKKKLSLSFSVKTPAITADFDPDLLEQVLNNLLSNAVKFTTAGKIEVDLEVIENRIAITISDTGMGIDPEQLPFLFDTYYRVETNAMKTGEGTGLGLPVARELIELHRGSIDVKSKPGKGSTFTVSFPQWSKLRSDASPGAETEPNTIISKTEHATLLPDLPNESDLEDSSAPLILVVDDNRDIRQHVRSILGVEYSIIEAVNGIQGVELAEKYVPDIIITDVLMPEANGYELCQKVKENPATNHIPVVMLTNQTEIEERVSSWQSGADAHLGKPFDQKELQVRVEKLLQIRHELRERYRMEVLTAPKSVETLSMDEQFLLKLRERMEHHLQNEHLTVEDLADEMALSRTQLHRKLKAIADQSVSEFIRTFRLERAHQLLQQNSGPVSEIAFLVGFASASYFSKAFSSRYGMSPREFKNQHKAMASKA